MFSPLYATPAEFYTCYHKIKLLKKGHVLRYRDTYTSKSFKHGFLTTPPQLLTFGRLRHIIYFAKYESVSNSNHDLQKCIYDWNADVVFVAHARNWNNWIRRWKLIIQMKAKIRRVTMYKSFIEKIITHVY